MDMYRCEICNCEYMMRARFYRHSSNVRGPTLLKERGTEIGIFSSMSRSIVVSVSGHLLRPQTCGDACTLAARTWPRGVAIFGNDRSREIHRSQASWTRKPLGTILPICLLERLSGRAAAPCISCALDSKARRIMSVLILSFAGNCNKYCNLPPTISPPA